MKFILFPVIISFLLFLTACQKDQTTDSSSLTGIYGLMDASFTAEGNQGTGSQDSGQTIPGTLTAGEWNDLNNWSFWSQLMMDTLYGEFPDYWNMHVSNRYSILITDMHQRPVPDIRAELLSNQGEKIWSARTDVNGHAALFSGFQGNPEQPGAIRLIVMEDTFIISQIHPFEYGTINHQISVISPSPVLVDISFVVDATGSMGDEIDYLKAELNDVILQAASGNNQLQFRIGSVFYRDYEDDYVTADQDFNTNLGEVTDFVSQQTASGGGDYPEAVHEGLEIALNHQWSPAAVCRILFLVLDAPPHYEPQILDAIAGQTRLAAQKRIKIIPMTASGIHYDTEFLMRLMAVATNGTYTFITDHSGIGDDHHEPTTGPYEVEFLNDLLIRLIRENCSPN
jgi:hypothetical protein